MPPPPEEVPLPPRRHPSTLGGAFYILVLLAAATAVGIVYFSHDWRLGVRVLASALAAAAGARLVLPRRDAGMLAVRHRLIDVFLLGGVSVVLFALATSIPDQPV